MIAGYSYLGLGEICCGAQSVQAVPDKRSGQLH